MFNPLKIFQKSNLGGSLSILDFFKTWFYKFTHKIRDPFEFTPFGFCVFNRSVKVLEKVFQQLIISFIFMMITQNVKL